MPYGRATKERQARNTAYDYDVVVYLREVDAGTNNACWVVCSKGDPGAVAFVQSTDEI